MNNESELPRVVSWLRKLWAVVWRFAILLTVWGILLAPFMLLFRDSLGQAKTWAGLWVWIFFEICGTFTLLAAIWGMLRFTDHRHLLSIGLHGSRAFRDIGWGILFGIGMIALSVLLLLITGNARVEIDGAVNGIVLLLAGVAVFLNAATQELLVRGYILQTIQSRYGAAAAVFVSSLIFAAMHPQVFAGGTPLPALNLFLIGLVFALAYVRTGNLWLPIAFHFGWNWLLGPVFGLMVSGRNISCTWQLVKVDGSDWITGGSFGIEGSPAATVACLIGLLLVHFICRKRQIPIFSKRNFR